jgi:hypothetical protein
MGEYQRSMKRLYSKWQGQAEIDAKGLEHMLAANPDQPDIYKVAAQIIHARNQCRIAQARIMSIEMLIEYCQRALSAAQLRPPDNYRISSLTQRLESLRADKQHFEANREEWNLRFHTASLGLGDSVVTHSSHPALVATSGRAPSFTKTPRKRVRPNAPCFGFAVELLSNNPNLTLVQLCREMDLKAAQYPSAPRYKPPTTWRVRTFYEQYQKRSNTVSRFLSDVRAHIKGSLDQTT